jgi:hypothetical protein
MPTFARADWPLGSNARLLAHQVRTATGYTKAPDGVMRNPPGWGGINRKVVDLADGRAADGPDRLYALLKAIARNGEVVPRNDALAERLGLTAMSTQRVATWLGDLETRGLIQRRPRGPRREIVMLKLGIVLSAAERPVSVEAV